MPDETTTLADELRQVARNLDRAAGISAQYCASGHHTDAIRRAADRLEELEAACKAGEAWLTTVLVMIRDRDPNKPNIRAARDLCRAAHAPRPAAHAPRPAAPPDPDRHHIDELRRIMAADRPGGDDDAV